MCAFYSPHADNRPYLPLSYASSASPSLRPTTPTSTFRHGTACIREDAGRPLPTHGSDNITTGQKPTHFYSTVGVFNSANIFDSNAMSFDSTYLPVKKMTHLSIQHGQHTQVVFLLISFCSLHQHTHDRVFTVSSGANVTTALPTDADISSTDCPVLRCAHGKRVAGPDQRADVVPGACCVTSVPPIQRCLRQLA